NGPPPAAANQLVESLKPCSSNHANASFDEGKGNGKRRQRDTIVGNKRSGASATNKNTVCSGGSSSIFNSALAETVFKRSAGYSTATRQPPRWVAVVNQDCN